MGRGFGAGSSPRPSSRRSGTTHGSLYSYDTHIPILFFGSAFRAGRYADEFSITDIAQTLCAALRMNEPFGSLGKPLLKLLAGQGPPQPRDPSSSD